MLQLIPTPVLSVVASVCAIRETHVALDGLFAYADAPGEPPDGSKPVKALAWLRRTNRDSSADPLAVLGKMIEGHMETPLNEIGWLDSGDGDEPT